MISQDVLGNEGYRLHSQTHEKPENSEHKTICYWNADNYDFNETMQPRNVKVKLIMSIEFIEL